MTPYPPPMVANPKAFDINGEPVEGEPAEVEDPSAQYDMNGIFALINCTTSNLKSWLKILVHSMIELPGLLREAAVSVSAT